MQTSGIFSCSAIMITAASPRSYRQRRISRLPVAMASAINGDVLVTSVRSGIRQIGFELGAGMIDHRRAIEVKLRKELNPADAGQLRGDA